MVLRATFKRRSGALRILICVPSALEPLSHPPFAQLCCITAIQRKRVSKHVEFIVIDEAKQVATVLIFADYPIFFMNYCFDYNCVEGPTLPLNSAEIRHIGTDVEYFPLICKTLFKPT